MGNGDRFVYVTFIRTTQDKLWDALTKSEFTRQYWFGSALDSTWEPSASWQLHTPDGGLTDSGKVVEIDKPHRLVLTWKHERFPDMRDESENARATFELEPQGEVVKLTVTHESNKKDSKLIKGVSGGWPIILASLKSLLETGKPIERTKTFPKGK
jgi:uncharacterized protein YndB with AHSA1/START domain